MQFNGLLRTLALSLLVVTLVAACSSDDSTDTTEPGPDGSSTEVTIDNFTFSPSSLSVAAGDTVEWTNDQSITHTVTSNDELFDMTLSEDATFEFTFEDAGTYPYFCAIHPAMVGTIEVTG